MWNFSSLKAFFFFPPYQLFMNLFSQQNYSTFFFPSTRNNKTSNHKALSRKKISLSRSFPIACCFQYDFFNYVLTSGSKSNMAQLFRRFSGLYDTRTLRIRGNYPWATYVKYNFCLFATLNFDWAATLHFSNSLAFSSGPFLRNTTTENVYTQQKSVWLILFSRFRGDFVRIPRSFRRIFSQKIFLSSTKSGYTQTQNGNGIVFEYLLCAYRRRKIVASRSFQNPAPFYHTLI